MWQSGLGINSSAVVHQPHENTILYTDDDDADLSYGPKKKHHFKIQSPLNMYELI